MTKRFCNALAEAPQLAVAAGDETVVQLVPPGDWPQWDEDGKEFVQTCDEATFQTLLANFDGEVLVDADHASERGDARDTRAYAWIQALSLDEGGALCGAFKWTDIGAEAVSNRRYRFVSVCWACEEEGKGRWRPVKLVSVALTNTPNIPAKPILNQQESAGGASADQPEKPEMEELKTLLGLPPEAGDAEVLEAVKALKGAVEAANEEKEAAEAAFAPFRGRWLTREDMERHGLWREDRKFGDAIFLADAGVQFCPSDMGVKPLAGMHGFDPADEDSTACWLSTAPVPGGVARVCDYFRAMTAPASPAIDAAGSPGVE